MNTQKPTKSFSYLFAHIALPDLIHKDPQQIYHAISGTRGTKFINSLWRELAQEIKTDTPEPEPEITVTKQIFGEGIEGFSICLPEPNTVPEAKFVAPVFWIKPSEDGYGITHTRYFTYEKGIKYSTITEAYYLCEWDAEKRHLNLGTRQGVDEENFIQAIRGILQK